MIPADDLRCATCQACCCQLPVRVLPGDDPPRHLIDEDDEGYLILAKADDGWCVALDRASMRCTIYEGARSSAASSPRVAATAPTSAPTGAASR